MNTLPEIGLLRLRDIVGDRNADPPIPALIPIGKSTWWAGVKSGRFPAPVKLGPRTTVWRWADIRALIGALEREEAPVTPKRRAKKENTGRP